jgi:2-succinyl-5-enolpyruvyl-6-hydroxy-3-cyclohexene-1-carboxylate synthase
MSPVGSTHATEGARLVVDALVGAGVGDVVIAPGSRSTPLVAACARDARVRCHVVHDERSGAFVALGLGRGGRTAALLVTSGTAVANAWPAVVEADADHVPMVILSADRPPEATGTDANQTIDQRFFFAGHVRAFVDLPPPEDQAEPSGFADAVVDVVHAAHDAPRGPVHVNARYRKPLEPVSSPLPRATRRRHLLPRPVLDDTFVEDVAALWTLPHGGAGVVVAGAARTDDEAHAFAALARAIGWPTLACASSGLRDPALAGPGVLGAASALVAAGIALPDVDVVVRIGGAVVDDAVAGLVGRAGLVVRIDDDDRRRLERAGPTTIVHAPCRELATALERRPRLRAPLPVRWQHFTAAHERALGALARSDDSEQFLDEPLVARRVVDLALVAGVRLFVGNSMPIRTIDRLVPRTPRVIANRGASGIDGLLSTAAGLAMAHGPTVALVGDVSFLHDAGALSALSAWGRKGLPLRVVVVDNRGGHIFDHLPIARCDDLLVPYFTTPHDVDLVAVARAYGASAVGIDNDDGLQRALARPIDGLEIVVAAVAGHSDDGVARHRRAYAAVAAAVQAGSDVGSAG